jgi:hypothetical protein
LIAQRMATAEANAQRVENPVAQHNSAAQQALDREARLAIRSKPPSNNYEHCISTRHHRGSTGRMRH